jgi:hypothetical protein
LIGITAYGIGKIPYFSGGWDTYLIPPGTLPAILGIAGAAMAT